MAEQTTRVAEPSGPFGDGKPTTLDHVVRESGDRELDGIVTE